MSVFRFLSAFPEASARSAESSRASDAREEARAANRGVAELRFQLDRLSWTLDGAGRHRRIPMPVLRLSNVQ
jgi:hypothetical protein